MTRPAHTAALRRSRLLLLFVVVAAAWWPIHSYWQSDDFLAVTYASDWRRALRDFVGNQYGAPGMVWFYRPLITLSFAVDTAIGGGAPFVSHASNCLAHGASSVMVAWLAERVFAGAGLRAGLLWGLWPAHAGSILWAVGRVDSHTVVWILLTVVLVVRWLDRGRGLPIAALAAAAAALASKELALVVPGLVAVAAFGFAPAGRRARQALRATVPFAVLATAYLGFRWLILGRVLGGYESGSIPVGDALLGLARWSGRCVNALDQGSAGEALGGVVHLGLLAPLWAVLALLRRRRAAAVLLLAIAFAGCTLPLAQFWPQTSDIKNARYFYLPAAAALIAVAGGGRGPALVALGLAVWPWVEVRGHYLALHRRAARMHAALQERLADAPPGPVFVGGLPRENRHGDVVAFHLWIDRLLEPPFGDGSQRPRALRPLAPRPGLIPAPAEAPPLGSALVFTAGDRLEPAAAAVGDLEVRIDGPAHLDNAVIWDLHRRRRSVDFVVADHRSAFYRLTIYTGCGTLSAVLPDEAPAAATDGRIGVSSWLRARYATIGDDAHVLFALAAPAAFDLEPVFPVWVEAGTCAGGDPARFVPTRAASRCVMLRFDRDLAELVAGRTPDPAGGG